MAKGLRPRKRFRVLLLLAPNDGGAEGQAAADDENKRARRRGVAAVLACAIVGATVFTPRLSGVQAAIFGRPAAPVVPTATALAVDAAPTATATTDPALAPVAVSDTPVGVTPTPGTTASPTPTAAPTATAPLAAPTATASPATSTDTATSAATAATFTASPTGATPSPPDVATPTTLATAVTATTTPLLIDPPTVTATVGLTTPRALSTPTVTTKPSPTIRPTASPIPLPTATPPPPTPTETPAPLAGPIDVIQGSDRLIGPGVGGEGQLTSLIASAHRRVLVEAYTLDDGPVVTALETAARNGVDVRVMLDPHGLSTTATLSSLQGAGIRTRSPSSHYPITHLNVVVVDASTVAVASQGFTGAALGPSGEAYLAFDRDPRDVLQAASLFYDDWLRRPVGSFGHNLVVVPDNSAEILALIGAASSRVELYTSGALDAGLAATIGQARARGVAVHVVGGPGGDPSQLQTLAGSSHARMANAGSGTVLVVDRVTVLIGSMDLSTATLGGNRELGATLTGPAAASAVDAWFFSLFARGQATFLSPPGAAPSHATPGAAPSRTTPGALPTARAGRRTYPVASANLNAVVDVPSLVRSGDHTTVTVTSQPNVRIGLSFAVPGVALTRVEGVTDGRGVYTYRWLVPRASATGGLVRVDLSAVHNGYTLGYFIDIPLTS